MTLSLFGPESTGVLSATVTNTIPWGNQLGREMRDVIVPVKIEVPANAPVPSIWSGNLIGKIEVAQPAGDGQFVTTEKDVNVAVTMHVTTQDEITTISKKIEDAARNEMIGSNLRFWLTLGAILLVIFALTVIVDFGKKRWGW